MGSFAKVTIILLVILALTTILLTPTLQDDVVGLLHKAQVNVLQTSSVVLGFLITLPVQSVPQLAPSLKPDSSALLDLVCVRLC